MNINLIIQGKIELFLAVLSGIFIYFASLKAFSFFIKGIDEEKEFKKNNAAVSLLISAFIFGIMLLIKESISPSMENLGYTLSAGKLTSGLLLSALFRVLIIYLVSAVCSFIFLFISIKFFMLLTVSIDEIKEIKKNNVAIALLIGTFTISVALLTMEPLKTLLKSFISAPVVSGAFKEPFINKIFLVQGIIEIVIALSATLFVFLFSFKVYDFLTKNIDETKELKSNNIAISIQISSFIFSIMLIVKASLFPAFAALQNALMQNISAALVAVTVFKIILIFVLSAAIAFLVLWLVMIGFMYINKNLDEMKEIKEKNIAVAIAIAVLLISSSLLVQHGVMTLLSSFI